MAGQSTAVSARELPSGLFTPFTKIDLRKKKDLLKLSIPQKRAYLVAYALATGDLRPDKPTKPPKGGKGDALPKPLAPKADDKDKRAEVMEWARGLGLADLDRYLSKVAPQKLYSANTASAGKGEPPPGLQNAILGFLAYEKLVYEDHGLVRSEDLVAQFTLPPGGEITLERKSWSKATLEFEESQAMQAEQETENSSSEDKELTEATSKQQQYGMSLSASGQASGDWGAYKVSANVATTINAAVTLTRQESTREKQILTRKAAARSRKEHKLTVKRATEVGSESRTVEKWTNRNRFHAVEYKFYKAMRNWKVRHELHDVALCADVMVRNPGVNLRKLLDRRFDPASVPPISVYFPPGDLPAPDPVRTESINVNFGSSDENRQTLFMFTIPQGYELTAVHGVGDKGRVAFHPNFNDMILGGDMTEFKNDPALRGNRVYNRRFGTDDPPLSATATLTAYFKPKTEYIDAWKTYATELNFANHRKQWETEQELWAKGQQDLNERRTVPITQVLRQQERDEVCSAVARFLLEADPTPEPAQGSDSISFLPGSSTVAGRLIATLQDCFDWRNASLFLYPYWWDPSVFSPSTIEDILRIDHQDHLRTRFLQSSWARVIVPATIHAELTVLELMYGTAVLEAIRARRLDKNASIPAELVPIVTGYLELETARNGRLKQTENLTVAGDTLSDSNVTRPAPIILAEWDEYTPTDETRAELAFLLNDAGIPINIGEEAALEEIVLEHERSEAITAVLTEAKDHVDGAQVTIGVADQPNASIGVKVAVSEA